jgi:hypothetical protein
LNPVHYSEHIMKLILSLLVVSFLALPLHAAPAAKPNPHTAALQKVRPAELPAHAAGIVAKSPRATRLETARDVVLAAAEINPGSVIPVVGAIAKSTPPAAAMAAAAGAYRQPEMARFIARSAAIAASDQVTAIIEAVAREVPNTAHDTVLAVSRAVPNSDRAAIEGLRQASPGWIAFLDEASVGTAAAPQDASTTVIRAVRLMNANGTSPIQLASTSLPPRVGPPFQTPPGNPEVIIPGPPFEVPPGWERRYSRP